MADQCVQSYLSISNAEDRRKTLIKLIEKLSVDERKVLIDAASCKNDLLPTLPPEILLEIFSYLPVQDAWSLQHVNSRWRDALSSDQLLRTALLRWDTHDPFDSGRQLSDIRNDPVRSRILHHQSLRFGKPLSVVEFDDTGTGLQGPQPQLSHRKLDLKGKHIAYISSKPGEGDAVVLRDLESGSVHTHYGEARERVITLALSTRLLAFVTFDGYLHVVRLSEPATNKRNRLPSANIRAFGADGSMIVVAMGKSGVPHLTQLLVFDAETGRLNALDVESTSKDCLDSKQSLNSFSVLVDDRRKITDVFALAHSNERRLVLNTSYLDNRRLEITHFRVDLATGAVEKGYPGDYELEDDEHIRTSHLTMDPPVPTGHPNRFSIQVAEIPLLGGLPMRLKMHGVFDVVDGRVEEDDDLRPGFVFPPYIRYDRWEVAESPYLRDGPFWPSQPFAPWKTLAIKAIVHRRESPWLEYCLLMNDTFLVSLEVSAARMQHSRIRVFSFDPMFNLNGGRSTDFWEDGKLLPKHRWYDAYSERSSRGSPCSDEDMIGASGSSDG